MKDFPVTDHFSYLEMVATSHKDLQKENEAKGISYIPNMRLLCNGVLEPIRYVVGPMVITSGFRCDALNKLVGGVDNSFHKFGLAADWKIKRWKTADEMIQHMKEVIASLVARSAIVQSDTVCEVYDGKFWVHSEVDEGDSDYDKYAPRLFVYKDGDKKQIKIKS